MSSGDNSRGGLNTLLDDRPWLESFLEILVAVVATFLPMAIAAFIVFSRLKTPETETFMEQFFSFFEKGEVALLVLAACGAIMWILIFRSPSIAVIVKFVFFAPVIFVAYPVAIAIVSGNPGFKFEQQDWLLGWLWILYWVCTVIWFVVSGLSKTDLSGGDQIASVARADALINAARGSTDQ